MPCRLAGSNERSWKTFCFHFPVSARLDSVIAQKRAIWKIKHLKLVPKIRYSTNVSQTEERYHRSQLVIFLFVVCLNLAAVMCFLSYLRFRWARWWGEWENGRRDSRQSWSAEADDCIVPEDSQRRETFSTNLRWSFSSIRSFPGMPLSFLTSYYTNTSLYFFLSFSLCPSAPFPQYFLQLWLFLLCFYVVSVSYSAYLYRGMFFLVLFP